MRGASSGGGGVLLKSMSGRSNQRPREQDSAKDESIGSKLDRILKIDQNVRQRMQVFDTAEGKIEQGSASRPQEPFQMSELANRDSPEHWNEVDSHNRPSFPITEGDASIHRM